VPQLQVHGAEFLLALHQRNPKKSSRPQKLKFSQTVTFSKMKKGRVKIIFGTDSATYLKKWHSL
jgi:ADP-dependent phosphofructokinase/glucokinase